MTLPLPVASKIVNRKSKITPIVVILNPASGRGQGRRRREELERLLSAECGDTEWRIIETERPGGGTFAAKQAVEDGAGIVAAAGGDGTYGEVVNGIVGTGAKLAILPLGTGNDFSRSLAFKTDLAAAVHTLFHGE